MIELKVVTAGISDVVFHATDANKLISMFKHNELRLSSTDAKEAEKEYSDTKNTYYLSSARNMESRYVRDSDLVIELDGKKLAQNFKGKAVDYWGYGIKGTEQEDRIMSKTPVIKNATKYIKAVHVVTERNKDYWEKLLPTLAFLSKKHKVPVITYKDHRARNARKKGTPIDKIPGISLRPPKSKATPSFHADDLFGIIQYMKALQKYAKLKTHLESWDDFAKENNVPKRWARYHPWRSDLIPQVKSVMHNLNKDKNTEVVKALHKISKITKSFGFSSFTDYLQHLSKLSVDNQTLIDAENKLPFKEKDAEEETRPDYVQYKKDRVRDAKMFISNKKEKIKYDWFTSLSVPAQKAYLREHKKSTITDHLVQKNGK